MGSNFTDEGISPTSYHACPLAHISPGILFRLDSDLTLHRVIENVTIPNGTSWSLDNKTMYFTDSPSQTIMAYPYDPETGGVSISEGKPFFKVDEGVPDGHCQDEEGCLWVANHGAGKVWRVNPKGEVIARIDLPTRCVTCPAFCGSELFITSMHEGDPEKYPVSRFSGRIVLRCADYCVPHASGV